MGGGQARGKPLLRPGKDFMCKFKSARRGKRKLRERHRFSGRVREKKGERMLKPGVSGGGDWSSGIFGGEKKSGYHVGVGVVREREGEEKERGGAGRVARKRAQGSYPFKKNKERVESRETGETNGFGQVE